MRVIYRKIRHARYLHIKRNVEKVWGARYTLGARYLSKNTVIVLVNTVMNLNVPWRGQTTITGWQSHLKNLGLVYRAML